jgi:hypothetical protein
MRPSNPKPAAKPTAEGAQKPAAEASTRAPKPTEPNKQRPAVSASVTPEKNGGVIVKLEYAGALAQYEPLWVRMGERRAGRDWVNTRDVKLERAGALATTKVELPPGEPIDGANFAFHTKRGEEELWDNAGHAFGCYVLDARTGAISAR